MGNRELGRIGEQAAAELLQMEGYEILERNYRCQAGEIDLIAARGSEVSFVEVKTGGTIITEDRVKPLERRRYII